MTSRRFDSGDELSNHLIQRPNSGSCGYASNRSDELFDSDGRVWDPMLEDYLNPENCYTEGPGKDIPRGKQVPPLSVRQLEESKKAGILELFVTGIPKNLNEGGLKKLFSRAGHVKKCKIVESDSQRPSYGFVGYSTSKELDEAIATLDHYEVGSCKLRVRPSQSKELRDQRRIQKEDEERLDKRNRENFKNAQEIKKLISPSSGAKMKQNSVSNGGQGQRTVIKDTVKSDPVRTSPIIKNSGDKIELRPCLNCGTLGDLQCSRCKGPYCSSQCQGKDWSNHYRICTKKEQFNGGFETRFEVSFESDVLDPFLKDEEMTDRIFRSSFSKSKLNDVKINSVIITHVNTPNDLYLILDDRSEQVKKLTDQLTQKMNEMAPDPNFRPKVDEVCAAQFSGDERWYRAHVKHMLPNNHLLVHFLDFGNEEQLRRESIRRLPAIFFNLPIQAIHCSMSGIRTSSPKGQWPPEDLDTMKKEFFNQDKYKATVQMQDDKFSQISLFDAAGKINLNHIFVDHGFAVKVEEPFSKTISPTINRPNKHASNGAGEKNSKQPRRRKGSYKSKHVKPRPRNSSHSTQSSDAELSMSSSSPQTKHQSRQNKALEKSINSGVECRLPGRHKPSSPHLPKPTSVSYGKGSVDRDPVNNLLIKENNQSRVPSISKDFINGQKFVVNIIETESPSHFYIHVPELIDSEAMVEMHQKLNEHYSCKTPAAAYKVTSFNLVAAKFEGDWYRGHIFDIGADQNKVRFLDYGNVSAVSFSDLHSLDSMFLAYPCLAVRCQLEGVLPVGEDWSPEACRFFQSLVVNKDLTATVRHHDDFTASIDLSDGVGEKLKSKGFAKLSSDSVSESAHRAVITPRHISDLPLHKVPAGSLELMVSHVNNPHSFYAQDLSLAEEFSNLSELVNTESLDGVEPSVLEENMLIAAYEVQDGCWYRACVLSNRGSKVDVFYVDYGNIGEVARDHVRCLSEEMLKLPRLAMQCKLVTVKSTESQWSPDAISMFCSTTINQCLKFTVSCQDPALLEVTELETVTNEDVIGQLITAGFARKIEKMLFLSDIDLQPLEVDWNGQVQVVHVNSPRDFYVQVQPGTGLGHPMAELFMRMNEYYEGKASDLSEAQVGQVVAGLFDGGFFRAEVLEVSASKLKLRFVDYGNEAYVEKANVHLLCEEFSKPLIQAYHCLLGDKDGPKKWSEAATETFTQITLNEIFDMSVAVVKGTKHCVDLIHVINGSVLEKMSADGLQLSNTQSHIAKQGTVPQNVTNKPPISARATCSNRQIAPLDLSAGWSGHALVCYVNDDHEFFIQPSFMKEEVDSLNVSLQSVYEAKAAMKTMPSTGQYVACKFEDMWARACVQNVQGSSIEVHFIDYGNSETVQMDNMRELEDSHYSTRVQCISCNFHSETEIEFHEPALSWMRNNLVYELFECTVHGKSSGKCQVSLSALEGDILDYLMALQVVQPVQRIETPARADNVGKRFVLERSKIPEDGSSFQCAVDVVKNPGLFYIQPVNQDLQDCHKMMSHITEFCQTVEPNVQHRYAIGDLCLAKFYADGCWYRAEVTALNSDASYQVLYVDFGNSETVRPDTMIPIPAEFTQVPRLAIPCSLAELEPDQGTRWSEVSCCRFKQITQGIELKCQVASLDSATGHFRVILEMHDPASGQSVDVASRLRKEFNTVQQNLQPCDIQSSSSQAQAGSDVGHMTKEELEAQVALLQARLSQMK